MAVTLTVILGKNTFYDVRDMRQGYAFRQAQTV